MRAMNLTKALNARGHRVVLWSTDFYHQEKRHRFGCDKNIRISDLLEIRLITSRGYQRNIGPARFFDHAQLGWRFNKLACKVEKPDLAFIGFPPIEIAAAAVRHCRLRGVPTLLDVKDLWPDLFEDPLPAPLRPVARLILSPLRTKSEITMREATGICGTTDAYLEWARTRGGRKPCTNDIVAPITPEEERISDDQLRAAGSWWDERGILADSRPRACFVGNLGRTSDFTPIIRAAKMPHFQQWQFVIAGSGDQQERWTSMARSAENIIFSGRINLPKISSLFERSTIALAPFQRISNYRLNVPNKINDYLSHGLHVVTPLDGPTRTLLTAVGAGHFYNDESHISFAKAILEAYNTIDDAERTRVKSKFASIVDPSLTYERLVDHIEHVAAQSK